MDICIASLDPDNSKYEEHIGKTYWVSVIDKHLLHIHEQAKDSLYTEARLARRYFKDKGVRRDKANNMVKVLMALRKAGQGYLSSSVLRKQLKIQDKKATTLRNAVNALIDAGAIISTNRNERYGKNCSFKLNQDWYDTVILKVVLNSCMRTSIVFPHSDALEAA